MGIGTIELGIRSERVNPSDHIAILWETPEQFMEGVGFLAQGLSKDDHCVIFGHDEANELVCKILTESGFDIDSLQTAGRLTILGGREIGNAMLNEIGGVFQQALQSGAPLIRLLGNIGWGKPNWPKEREILNFEAQVTTAAKAFHCVVVCMYDVRALPSHIILHGAFETHPLTVCGNILRVNPYYKEMEDFFTSLPKYIEPSEELTEVAKL
jgi:MEDS: MEthanogen/methylotroph, DcmR Sensory domain